MGADDVHWADAEAKENGASMGGRFDEDAGAVTGWTLWR